MGRDNSLEGRLSAALRAVDKKLDKINAVAQEALAEDAREIAAMEEGPIPTGEGVGDDFDPLSPDEVPTGPGHNLLFSPFLAQGSAPDITFETPEIAVQAIGKIREFSIECRLPKMIEVEPPREDPPGSGQFWSVVRIEPSSAVEPSSAALKLRDEIASLLASRGIDHTAEIGTDAAGKEAVVVRIAGGKVFSERVSLLGSFDK